MKKSIVAFAAAFVAIVGLAPAAYADADYKFDTTFNNGSATETVNAQLIVSNGEVVGIAGSVDGVGFTGANSDLNGVQSITQFLDNTNFPGTDSIRITATGTDLIFDNVFSGGSLTTNGIVFQVANGVYMNLWENSPGRFELFLDWTVFDAQASGTLQVPEPSTLAMMLTALLALGGLFFVRRRGRTQEFSAI